MWDVALQGIGAGIQGGLEGYTWQQEHELKKTTAEERAEVARLKEEIRLMIAELNEGGRNARHATPSGNVITQQTEQSARTKLVEDGKNQRWFAPSGNAVLGSETTRRGQDTTAATARRGQDIGATTTRRGQDLTFRTNENRDDTTRRGQNFNLGRDLAVEAGRTIRHNTPSGSSLQRGGASANPYGSPPITTGQPTAPRPRLTMDNPYRDPLQPSDAPDPSMPNPTAPGQQQAPRPLPNQPAVDPKLAEQVKNLTAQFDASTDEDEKAVIQNAMRRLLQQLKGGAR